LASPPGVAGPLTVAGLCVMALALTWVVAALVPAGQFKDAATLYDFTLLSHTHANGLAKVMLLALVPALYIAWCVVVVAVALVRERPRVALACGLVLALTPLTAEAVKPLMAHAHARIGGVTVGAASWPSGHASAALALVLCAVLVAPARWRAIVAVLGGAFALAVGCSLLIQAWHMPSDVVGGYLLATLWTAVAIAGLRVAGRRWPVARGDHRTDGRGVGRTELGSGAPDLGIGAVGARVPQ
jgi:membrane-associated phospholipid phosphatase